MFDSCFAQFKLDCSKKKHLTVYDLARTEEVSAGGHVWRITCYPHGHGDYSKQDDAEYVSIFLKLKPKLMRNCQNFKAIFQAFVVDRDGVPPPSSSHARNKCVHVRPPEPGSGGWGWPRFVKRGDLELLGDRNGWVRIMCNVVVVMRDEDPSFAVPAPAAVPVPPSDIGSHLGRLLDCADGSDVSFVVGGENFPAHRAVLAARSPVFKAQLLGSMADATMSSSTPLHGIGATAFKVMLRFMYTDTLPKDDELGGSPSETFQDLLAAADRYALDRLKLLCADKLWNDVSVETIAATLSCAETYNCRS
ncbi:hypothetical protein ACP70R_000478 [Stipagrostis hirtigluma subsp. patula]